MPFDAEDTIQRPIQEYLINTMRAELIMQVLDIPAIGDNLISIRRFIEDAPKNSSDEELIDHIAKYVQSEYQPEDPTFTVFTEEVSTPNIHKEY